MVSGNLVRHWMGMPKDELTAQWDSDQRDRFDEIMENQQKRLEETIVAKIGLRAKRGDIPAFEWLERRELISEDGRRSDKFVMLEAIANRARLGELDAVQWLEDRELTHLPK